MRFFSFKKRLSPEPVAEDFPKVSVVDEKAIAILKLLKGMRMCDAEQALFAAQNVMLAWHERAPFNGLPPCLNSPSQPASAPQNTSGEVGHG